MGHQARVRSERRLGTAAKPKYPFVLGGKVELGFSREEWAALLEFQRQVNLEGEKTLSLEVLCRQAIFLTIQQTYEQARKLEAQLAAKQAAEREAVNGGDSGVLAGNPETLSHSEDAAPDLLADPAERATETPAAE